MTTRQRIVALVAATTLGLAGCAAASEQPEAQAPTTTLANPTTTLPAPTTTHDHPSTTAAGGDYGPHVMLSNRMRDLWAEHMFWTYFTVDAFFNNPEELQPNLDRLLANQVEIGDAIKPFFGEEAGDQLAALLTEHIELAVPVLTAARDGDSEALDAALDDWYGNAQDVAEFVSAAGPEAWPLNVTSPMLKGHIDSTVVYATALLEGDYPRAIAEFDRAYDHMMMLSEALSAGIINQFPEQFAN
ncbi:MAG TPA: hypothetical protein VF246_10265 [Acidimicrobiia bacterium]